MLKMAKFVTETYDFRNNLKLLASRIECLLRTYGYHALSETTWFRRCKDNDFNARNEESERPPKRLW